LLITQCLCDIIANINMLDQCDSGDTILET